MGRLAAGIAGLGVGGVLYAAGGAGTQLAWSGVVLAVGAACWLLWLWLTAGLPPPPR